ncbi:Peroxisomal leader peptide-processing protease [Acipenser ruthenus]|uniref:Peroxisomal leader peptide-processing protease n=1 Tax=Acipenser ruthenus TaxID=7906 RepID=A0A444UF39_ACIRT|nr:Peroxisomal leader peptide-processing protease [Acipenser ruthenus]
MAQLAAMRTPEEICCVVTVFKATEDFMCIDRDGIQEEALDLSISQSDEASLSPRAALARPCEPWSCSGVVLNSQTGITVCHGLIFTPFLLNKDMDLSGCQFLLPENFSKQLQIEIQFSDAVPPEFVTARQKNHMVNQCSGKTYRKTRPQLNPLPQKAELLMLVPCLEFQETFQKMFNKSDKWQFYNEQDDFELKELQNDIQFLHWFAVLKVPGFLKKEAGAMPWVAATSLRKADLVFACGSPFGSLCPDIFMNTLSKGIVSNLAGEGNAVILTDARCLPGTEGGGLFLKKGGHFYLVGLIVSPLYWKASEWIGLTLVCSVGHIFKNMRRFVTEHDPSFKEIWPPIPMDRTLALPSQVKIKFALSHPSVVLVECGQFWGSGVLINSRLMLTCRHVLNEATRVTVKSNTTYESFFSVVGQVIFSTKKYSAYDIAVVQLQTDFPDNTVCELASSFSPGEDVLVVGFGVFGQSCGPSVTAGILSRVITCDSRPVMLQTTCAVHAGASGGAVLRAGTGELLGIVCSNTRDTAAGVTYPHLNFSIPVTVLQPLLNKYALTEDGGVFEELDRASDVVRDVWRLHSPNCQAPRSKL